MTQKPNVFFFLPTNYIYKMVGKNLFLSCFQFDTGMKKNVPLVFTGTIISVEWFLIKIQTNIGTHTYR